MYDTFIGLEIHIHLLTKTKAFCSCKAAYGDPPNTNVCPVCLGYPGVLPVLNEEAMRMAYLVSRALNCTLATRALFDRKNYYYPDMTKNYQISQFHAPVGTGGHFDIEVMGELKRVGIHDVHLEEDAGKMIHDGGSSLVDYNRAGTSLLEIVTDPDLKTPREAEIFIQSFRRLVRYLGVCDGNMEEGSLRCDANCSINHPGQGLGTKTEVKNMNSSRFARKALDYELKRQANILESGGRVIQETRLWDESSGTTAGMRSKESAHDYRYFPEPDLPPFCPEDAFLKGIENNLVPLPLTRKRHLEEALGIKSEFAEIIAEERATADYFDEVVAGGASPRAVANWLCGHVQAQLKLHADIENVAVSPLTPERLGALVSMVEEGRISASRGKQTLEQIFKKDLDPETIVKENGWEQIGDASEIQAYVDQVVAANPGPVAQIEGGNPKTIGFLVGQVMKLSKGQADPKEVSRALKARFDL